MATPSKSKTILIVDDDDDMRSFFKVLLENMGHEVYEAESNREAAELVEDVVPHLIFLDINLDNEKGFGLLEKLKDLDPYSRIQVIMVSASTSKKDIANSKEYGVHGYLVKPVTNKNLLSLMKKIGPDLNFPAYTIPSGNEGLHVMAKCVGEITEINEIGFIMSSKIRFTEPHKLEAKSSFFDRHGLSHAQFQIFKPSTNTEPGIYHTTVQFLGLNDQDLVEVRKIKTKKA